MQEISLILFSPARGADYFPRLMAKSSSDTHSLSVYKNAPLFRRFSVWVRNKAVMFCLQEAFFQAWRTMAESTGKEEDW